MNDMTAFDGARDMDAEDPRHIDWELFARMAEASDFWLAPEPLRRRHVARVIARRVVPLAIAVAVAWLLSDIAVAALLDERRLVAIGIS